MYNRISACMYIYVIELYRERQERSIYIIDTFIDYECLGNTPNPRDKYVSLDNKNYVFWNAVDRVSSILSDYESTEEKRNGGRLQTKRTGN